MAASSNTIFKHHTPSAMHIAFLSLSYMFFVYSRKVNDSNDSVIIRLNEKNSPSRDDIKTPSMSESSSSKELSTDEEIHPSGSNKMRFADTEEIKHDHSFYDERRYEKLLGCITISIK